MTSPSILLIDDDEDVRTVMSYVLEHEGVCTQTFASGFSALDYLKDLAAIDFPILIIVDFMMSELDGLEFIRLLRQKDHGRYAGIPVVLSSGRSAQEIIQEGMPPDVLVLEKPLELESFLELVRSYLTRPTAVSSL